MAKSDDDKAADKKEDAKGSGGIKEFLPLILALTIMPVVAFVMTQFVLVPQLQAKLGTGDTHAADGAHDDGHGPAAPAHGAAKKSSHGEAEGEGGSNMATVKKVLVNVKGTAATRYLVSSFALTGSGGNISTLVEEHDPQLRDIAMGILMNLSIDDLGQAEIKNRVKVMLVSAFNNALGGDYIENIFFTEFAVQ
jgi:flagellar basal body-associated protein FliL